LRDIIDLIDNKPELKEVNFYLEEEWKNNQIAKTTLELK